MITKQRYSFVIWVGLTLLWLVAISLVLTGLGSMLAAGLWVAASGLILSVLYYFWVFHSRKFGQTTFHQETLAIPPVGLSPAALRYIRAMHYDDKVFVTAIIDMAIKGFLHIQEYRPHQYRLVRQSMSLALLTDSEKKIAKTLFPGTNKEVSIDPSSQQRIQAAMTAFKRCQNKECTNKYFILSGWHFVVGIVLTILAYVPAYVFNPHMAFIALFVFMLTLVFSAITMTSYHRLKQTSLGRVIHCVGAVVLFAAVISLVVALVSGVVWWYVAIAVGYALIIVAFYYSAKRITLLGSQVHEQTQAFQRYLMKQSWQTVSSSSDHHHALDLFEQYLPYALALDCEKKWSLQFARYLQHQPAWYSKPSTMAFSLSWLSHSLGVSLPHAVAQAVIVDQSQKSS